MKLGSFSSPSFVKALTQDAKTVEASEETLIIYDGIIDIRDEDSFKFDPLQTALKSTQQLNIDWSKFENHTFFSSAEVKVNEAFNLLINSFPFDGSVSEVQKFQDKLTGYEKYLYEEFPTWSGALHLSGTQASEDFDGTAGTWISVVDKSGYLYPDISKNNKGETTINPGATGSFSIEALVHLPKITNSDQVLFQKTSTDSDGFTLYLKQSPSINFVTASFSITSGSVRAETTAILNKGIYNHVCAIFNREENNPEVFLEFFVNEKRVSRSNPVAAGKLNIDSSNFLIGTGSSFYSGNTLVTPTQTFSGTLDELRLFHSVRSEEKQKLYATRGIYSTPDLKLYYRFNEPPPPLSNSSQITSVDKIVLDSSGNSLHATINNFTGSLRVDVTSDILNPIKNEKRDFTVVLFPAYQDLKDLNADLLLSASQYDAANPNLIVKLIPKHYLLEGAFEDGFINEKGNIGNSYSGVGIPGEGVIGSTHLILTFLYIWSKFFDDIKLYVDSFGTLKTVDYDLIDTVPDNFLNDIIKNYGFYLPGFFNNSSFDKYTEDDNTENTYGHGLAFKTVSARILRRIILNVNDFIRSKGTLHSIKSFLRSVGIDPDNSIRIREYGGQSTKMLGVARSKKIEPIAIVDFVSGSSIAISSPLSGSRVEPGYPTPQGQFIKSNGKTVGTSNPSDGLFTSGSWTAECLYKFPPYKSDLIGSAPQSLLRLFVTGSETAANPGLVANVVATKKTISTPAKLKAYIRPGTSASSPTLSLTLDLSGSGIFDGERWNVSLSRKRSDNFGSDYLSSSYYLRAGKSNYGDVDESYTTSEFFYEKYSTEDNVFEVVTGSYNASGSYIAIGEGQTFNTSILYPFLNNTSEVDNEARTTAFNGWASSLRFWSKFINDKEWKEHVRNFKSVGVADPRINWNFTQNVTGSFEKLRMDTFSKQLERNADLNGNIVFVDHSYNNNVMSGSLFGSGSSAVVSGDVIGYSFLTPKIDEASTSEKVRIRGVTEIENLTENSWAILGPAYSSNEGFTREEPEDDLRLSIEFSLSDALDRDMVNMFSDFDILSDVLGKPENMFAPDYSGLEVMRDVYFNRLDDNINFRKFLEFYRWFDSSVSTFIDQLVPGKSRFKGTNFVIESHMLERHKREFWHSENYLGDKQKIKADKLLLQQIVGELKKY